VGAAGLRLPRVIAPSFADIFFNNCFKNGLLPIVLREAEVDRCSTRRRVPGLPAGGRPGAADGHDAGRQGVRFEVDAFRKHCLLNGLDEIGLTLQHATRSARSRRATAPNSPGCSAVF
jgi:3-isopropylmalate/(R)-2-methylmalate dehydratase small subunit